MHSEVRMRERERETFYKPDEGRKRLGKESGKVDSSYVLRVSHSIEEFSLLMYSRCRKLHVCE
jgi:hypothetical protein